MGNFLLSRLYQAAASGEPPVLRPFVSIAFAELLRSCPNLAARLFGDVIPIDEGTPRVVTDSPTSADITLDIVIEGRDGVHLLIENQIAPDLEWFEERTQVRPTSHVDNYIASARQRFGGRARVLVLSRNEADFSKKNYPPGIFAGRMSWSVVYDKIREFLPEAGEIPSHLIHQFLDLLKEHDMSPSESLVPTDADTIAAFDQFTRNSLKLLDEAVGRIRQEFDLKAAPNNRRLTGWYACSDRFQCDDLHLFFYLMFPPVPELVVRLAVQVTKESTQRVLTAVAEHGFRRGRWGSLWVERDFRRHHPFLNLSAPRQVEELVQFFQTPLARLARIGLVRVTPAQHEAPPHRTRGASGSHGESARPSGGPDSRQPAARPAVTDSTESAAAPASTDSGASGTVSAPARADSTQGSSQPSAPEPPGHDSGVLGQILEDAHQPESPTEGSPPQS